MKIWKFAPGEQAEFWGVMFDKGVAAIGWGNRDFTGKTKEQIKTLDNAYFAQYSHSPAIIEIINKIQIGDYLFAFKGTTTLIGYGIVKSAAKYSTEAIVEDYHNYIEIEWHKFEQEIKTAKVNQNTFVDINDRLDEFLKYIPSKGEQKMASALPLNQILYGPPGTGKTYNTIAHALSIVEGKSIENLKAEARAELKKRFDKLPEDGQIVFTTFHQSYGYEEFVEGIKPVFESEEIEYEIKPGIFKKICELASEKEGINFDEKIEWLKSECDEAENKSVKIGNFTVTYRGKKTFRIQPDKSKHKEADYPASIANIEKIYKGGSKKEIYNPTYVNGILEYLYKNGLKKYSEINNTASKPHILIIDEINRGNISKIFGELITLIEESKRLGKPEELKAKLSYSNEEFGVPQNLYIIGTMNTADRSIALMDTALRRRFEFVEMMPEYGELNFEIDGINIGEMLKKINKRIEYLYDRDHQIGHAYFIGISSFEELQGVFKIKIIPLLQEYFYDDWEKIQIVLGDHINQFDSSKKETPKNFYDKNCKELSINKYRFIQSIEFKEIDVIGFNHEDIEDEQINYKVSDNFEIECYKKIYEKDAYTRIKDKVDNKTIEQNNVEGL